LTKNQKRLFALNSRKSLRERLEQTALETGKLVETMPLEKKSKQALEVKAVLNGAKHRPSAAVEKGWYY